MCAFPQQTNEDRVIFRNIMAIGFLSEQAKAPSEWREIEGRF